MKLAYQSNGIDAYEQIHLCHPINVYTALHGINYVI